MKPILFNTNMVRAIQADRKTVTRRVVKPQPIDLSNNQLGTRLRLPPSPYLPGDILYVRETWCINNITPHDLEWNYKADYDCTVYPHCNWKWRPSIHMPREAARIFLRVTDVRVQQLKDVTGKDARAEGFYTRAEFIAAILKMYPDCTADSWLWVIEFERISREEAMNESKNIH